MTSAASQAAPAILVLALIVLLLARRTYRLTTGVLYSPSRLFSYGGFSAFLFVLFGTTTIYVAVGTWGPVAYGLVAAYAGVVVAAAVIARPRVERLVRFETRADGQLYYMLPIIIPALTLALFVVRVTAEVLLLGFQVLVSFTLPTSLPPPELGLLIAVDLVYGSSIGMLVGRGLGVLRAHAAYAARSTPLP